MRILSLLFVVMAMLFTSCDDDDPQVSPMVSFYVEMVDAEGKPIVTSDAEAADFLLVRAIPVEPKESLGNFIVRSSHPEKGEDGRYYLHLENNCATAGHYLFTLDSHAFKAPYSFEMTWDGANLKQVTINGEKPSVGSVTNYGKTYPSVALIVELR